MLILPHLGTKQTKAHRKSSPAEEEQDTTPLREEADLDKSSSDSSSKAEKEHTSPQPNTKFPNLNTPAPRQSLQNCVKIYPT
jgi:hypothetical protein